jgi:hypothetical protein
MSIEPNKIDFRPHARTIDDLKRARHMIANGWCQNRGRKRTWFLGRTLRCTTFAIGEACANDIDRSVNATWALFSIILPGVDPCHVGFDDKCTALVLWNDAKDRTKAEVLNAFDRAIASLE